MTQNGLLYLACQKYVPMATRRSSMLHLNADKPGSMGFADPCKLVSFSFIHSEVTQELRGQLSV